MTTVDIILLTVAAVAASELILHLPLMQQVHGLNRASRSSARVIASKRISDHWKERVLPAYSGRMARHSITFFVLLCVALAPVALLGFLAPGGFEAWLELLMTPLAIILLCGVSIAYIFLRLKMGQPAQGSSDYSLSDRVLHRLALASPMRAEMFHDIEKGMFLKSAPADAGNHVFVCGLARAGTTILMREIHGSDAFGSLTYADMPLVLAPNLWRKMSGRGVEAGEKKERAHGDGIAVDYHSPEALDEVYWRTFTGDKYIFKDRLIPHKPKKSIIAGYRDLMRLVMLRTGKRRYLSKNNNMILRLPALAKAMPEALFLVPVRDPVSHTMSLLSQHRRFKTADSFTQQYMQWLGHHEFGATHRPFVWGEEQVSGDPDTPDYWLARWISAHRALLSAAQEWPNILLIPSDDLSRDPALWPAIARRIGIDSKPLQEIRGLPERTAPDIDRTTEAHELYQQLVTQARADLA